MKHIVDRIMTKLAQRRSVWTSYRASYPTWQIYDEIWLFVIDVVWSAMKSMTKSVERHSVWTLY
jgi:hypothetical protein